MIGRLSPSFEMLGESDMVGEPPDAVSNEDAADKRFEHPCVCLNDA